MASKSLELTGNVVGKGSTVAVPLVVYGYSGNVRVTLMTPGGTELGSAELEVEDSVPLTAIVKVSKPSPTMLVKVTADDGTVLLEKNVPASWLPSQPTQSLAPFVMAPYTVDKWEGVGALTPEAAMSPHIQELFNRLMEMEAKLKEKEMQLEELEALKQELETLRSQVAESKRLESEYEKILAQLEEMLKQAGSG